MRIKLSFMAIITTMALASQPARACEYDAELNLADVKFANIVVVGRISNYQIIRDQKFRKMMLANPGLTLNERRIYESGSIMSDYAHFEIQVDKVLFGKAPQTISVTWDNSTFGEPSEMAPGPFLIAMRDPASTIPPLRGPSATIFPNQEPAKLTVLQAPCSSPFIFKINGDEAKAVQRILRSR